MVGFAEGTGVGVTVSVPESAGAGEVFVTSGPLVVRRDKRNVATTIAVKATTSVAAIVPTQEGLSLPLFAPGAGSSLVAGSGGGGDIGASKTVTNSCSSPGSARPERSSARHASTSVRNWPGDCGRFTNSFSIM